MAESTGQFLLGELRSILNGVEGLSQELTWSEETQGHTYPYVFISIGIEQRTDETEGGEARTWKRTWGGEINVRVEGGDTQNQGLARELSELWWDRIRSTVYAEANAERRVTLSAHKVRITSIELDESIPAWAFRENVGKATFNGTITYEWGPLS